MSAEQPRPGVLDPGNVSDVNQRTIKNDNARELMGEVAAWHAKYLHDNGLSVTSRTRKNLSSRPLLAGGIASAFSLVMDSLEEAFMFRAVNTMTLAILLGLGCAIVSFADHKYHAGSLEARDHGYEHGYSDGFHRGIDDRSHHSKFKPEVKDADAGYESYMGNKDQYKEGYRSGFVAGYDDGFNNRPGRFSEIYRPYGESDHARGDADRDDDIYAERGWSGSHVAGDIGYRDGIAAGQADFARHLDPRPEEQRDYRDADHGYRASYGDESLYRQQYRDAFVRGYQDAYVGRR